MRSRWGGLVTRPSGVPGLHDQVRAWRKRHAERLSDEGAHKGAFTLRTRPLTLHASQGKSEKALIDCIKRAAKRHGVPASLLVIDTASLALPETVDENSAVDVAGFIKALNRVRIETGCAVVLIHHGTKDGGTYRGSSAFAGNMDAVLHFKRDKGKTHGEVEAEKFRPAIAERAEFGFDISGEWLRTDEDGEDVTGGVATATPTNDKSGAFNQKGAESGKTTRKPPSKSVATTETVADKKAVIEVVLSGRAKPMGFTELRNAVNSHRASQGAETIPKGSFGRYLDDLVKRGAVTEEETADGSRCQISDGDG